MTTLIQNVSKNGIANIVAVKTFKPNRIIWICPFGFEEQSKLHIQSANYQTNDQHIWLVDCSDPKKLSTQLGEYFSDKASEDSKYIYHLSSGPKILTAQGLSHFISFSNNHDFTCESIVWDESNQTFDVIYPAERNDAYIGVKISLEDMLAVHGNYIDQNRPMRPLEECKRNFETVEKLRLLSVKIKNDMRGKNLKGGHDQESKNRKYQLISRKNGKPIKPLPASIVEGFMAASEMGLLNGLEIGLGGSFSFKQATNIDVYGYINGGWLEDWTGAILSELEWQQAGVGVQMIAGHHQAALSTDSQEFDFLGAHSNRLVYFSCKHTTELTPPQLFEIDALRDDIGGDANHTVGIVHAGKIGPGMINKAKRLGIVVIDVMEKGAGDKLLRVVTNG